MERCEAEQKSEVEVGSLVAEANERAAGRPCLRGWLIASLTLPLNDSGEFGFSLVPNLSSDP